MSYGISILIHVHTCLQLLLIQFYIVS